MAKPKLISPPTIKSPAVSVSKPIKMAEKVAGSPSVKSNSPNPGGAAGGSDAKFFTHTEKGMC